MPFKKIDDINDRSIVGSFSCQHLEHNPPGHVSLKPGVYEYKCPGCGEKRIVVEGSVHLSGGSAGK